MISRPARAVIAVALLAAGLLAWRAGDSWSYHHPALSHDCRMLAVNCPSRYAVWVPNGGWSPTYGRCACAATVTVTGVSR